ncbi:hypothetical protein GLOTRDRAFT_94327 [Gloeophyllum trabeum ATCC 11539]|uniref:F-box domain-containing protein n=1 Tax=Gloeophyllum trabeum (strain ATCC 11539 / FP-39264 / Madison 617) TaxID=670483 RepID=S7Q2Y3_GLOTA|nr:uncharacterized protein GLOTRDRAFT_94327 [Gloeophyllum trabeum ATCC 11539]EPQ53902.1 hypothetical protein GLOTRDRAFT_94327 [Gloeophyllum trabeum ATCC 11539]
MPQLLDLHYDLLTVLVSYLGTEDLLSVALAARALREISQDQLIRSVYLRRLDAIDSFCEFVLADSPRRPQLLVSLKVEALGWDIGSTTSREILERRLAEVLTSSTNLKSLEFPEISVDNQDSLPALRHALDLSFSRVTELYLSGKCMTSLLGEVLAGESARLRFLSVRLLEADEAADILSFLAPCRDTLESLQICNLPMEAQRLLFPRSPPIQWPRVHSLMLAGSPLTLDARDLQAAFPNVRHSSIPPGMIVEESDSDQQAPDTATWNSLISYTGYMDCLLALGGRCRVLHLLPCERVSEWQDPAFASALESTQPRYLTLAVQDHHLDRLCEQSLWLAAPELAYLSLNFWGYDTIDQLCESLTRLCDALKVTKLAYLSVRLPSPSYHSDDELLQSLMACIRSAVLHGFSSLKYFEVDIHYGPYGTQGLYAIHRAMITPASPDDIALESLDLSSADTLKVSLAE